MYKSLFVACALAAFVAAPTWAAQIQVTNTLQNAVWVDLDDSEVAAVLDDDPVTTLTRPIGPPFEFNAAPSTFSIGENNFGATHIAGQSFLATKGGRVDNVQMYVGGAPSLEYDVHLYDLGTPGFPLASHGTANDQMPANSWFRFNGAPQNAVVVLDVQSGGRAGGGVFLTAGNTYVWEIVGVPRDDNGVPTGGANASELTWQRNAPPSLGESYMPYGQAFRERGALNGNNDRSFAMAVHIVPEPATFALVGLGLIGLLGLRRRAS